MPFKCEMIYIVKIGRQEQTKISEYRLFEFLRVNASYQKKQPVKHKNIISTESYAISHILTAFGT